MERDPTSETHPEGLLPRTTSFIHHFGLGFPQKQILRQKFEFKWFIEETIDLRKSPQGVRTEAGKGEKPIEVMLMGELLL